jgi:alpha-tubulin suppressor-like RCC1 family protein
VIGLATAGDGEAMVSWSAPLGGTAAEVQSYVITPYVGSTALAPTAVAPNQTSAVVAGLTNGTTYTFRVHAIIPSGETASSEPSNPVTPLLSGAAYGWGSNEAGQLGSPPGGGFLTPTQIGAAYDWTAIDAGAGHTVAIKTDGTLWAWGWNHYGQLGDGTTATSSTPVQIGSATNWRTIAAGHEHTMAIRDDGTMWAWGNAYGHSPVQVGAGHTWRTVAAGLSHNLAIRTDGTLWAWGWNGYGQLGDGTSDYRASPVQIGNETQWASVAAGGIGTIAIKADGSLWQWGWTLPCCPEDEYPEGSPSPPPARVGTATNWATITAGNMHYAAIKTDSTLYTWGEDGGGQLGLCETSPPGFPNQVEGTGWADVDAGGYGTPWAHTVAVKTDGTLWAWGENSAGSVGDGTTTSRSCPTQIGGNGDWAAVAAGGSSTLAIQRP